MRTGGITTAAGTRRFALVAVAALVTAALIPAVRIPVLVLLVLLAVAARHDPALRRVAAATFPAALLLSVAAIPPPVPADLGWCAELLAPPALWRAMEAVIVIGAVLIAVRLLGARFAELGLVRPSRGELAVSVVVAGVVAIGGLVLGTWLAGPFFGTIVLGAGDPGSIPPALLLALANGAMEEVVYRGAMLAWLTPALGVRGALAAQALVFGAAHAGGDFTGSPLPVMAAVAATGLIAGLIVLRRRSLTFPLLVHAGFDIPLFYVVACRLG